MSDDNSGEARKEMVVALLRLRFGHMDFWSLNKKWKEEMYKQVAAEIHMIYNLPQSD